MNGKSQFVDIIDQAKRQGWRHEMTNSGHHKLLPPDGGTAIVTSSTPGDQRAFRNFMAGMKRSGFKPPDDRGELLDKRRVRGVKSAVRDFLHDNHGKAYSTDELRTVCAARVPGSAPSSLNNALKLLTDAGETVQLGRGMYRWHELPTPVVRLTPVADDVAVAAPAPEMDLDEREINQLLEDILAVSVRAEKLLRRYSSIAAKLKEFRKLLE